YKPRALREDPATCAKSREELLQSSVGGKSDPNHEPGCSARYTHTHPHHLTCTFSLCCTKYNPSPA
ncbi:hypothetical protein M9458_006462, partial [Cirrhinus mrigala]